MKKLFALFLVLLLLFLTACNHTPPVGTNADGSTETSDGGNTNSGNTSSGGDSYHWDWSETMQDQVVDKSSNELIELPSRILFAARIDGGPTRTYYYSKADGNAYVYCFDPLCDHTDYTCLGNPAKAHTGWYFSETVFVNNRFYILNAYGKIYSFAFDGSDKKLEYDAKYLAYKSVWGGMIAYGPYIYITSDAEESPHTLRYNVETKEMEDLTEKTGNYIQPYHFYNGMIYGNGDNSIVLDGFYKADLDLKTIEPVEKIFMDCAAGTTLVSHAYKERQSIEESPEKIGITFYDIKTDELRILSKEDLGLDYYPAFLFATDEYIYFEKPTIVYIGVEILDRGGQKIEHNVQKLSDGKIYRMNKDGTNIICVYDNPYYETNRNMVIFDDKVLMQGRYMKVENGEKKIWGGPVQVATINPDGTFGEFAEVEVLQ